MDPYGDTGDIFLLKIVAGTNLKISFVVDAKREDLETIKCLAIGEGLDAIWDELSPIKADRVTYLEPFINSIPKNQKLDVNKEYCVEEILLVLMHKKLLAKDSVPKALKNIVDQWMKFSKDESVSIYGPSIPLGQGDRMSEIDADMEPPKSDPDVVMIMEKMKSLLNGVERVWDDTTRIISDIQQLDAKVHKIVKMQESFESKLDSEDVDLKSGQVRIEKKVDLCKTGMGRSAYDEVIMVKDSRVEGEQMDGADQRKDRKYSCPYCQEDNHRFVDCEEKTECMRCGNNNHKLDYCNFKSDMKCYVWKEEGHVSMLHSAVKVDFRLALINHYGSKCFGHFLESKEDLRRTRSIEQEGWLDRKYRPKWRGVKRNSVCVSLELITINKTWKIL